MKIITAKLTKRGVLLNGATALPDGNTGYLRNTYNLWLAAGNTPEPISAPTDTQKVAEFRTAVSLHIDTVAQSYGFDSILTAVTYADEPAGSEDQAYGIAMREWRSVCWVLCRQEVARWQAGGAEPTISALIDGLPVFSM